MARLPLYKATETEMIRKITTGEWAVGLRLPNEFGLADEFGVSQGTMRRALITLEGMGLLERKPGRGTIVSAPTPAQGGNAPTAPRGGVLRDATGAAVILQVHRARADTRGVDASELALFGAARLATLSRVFHRDGVRAGRDEVALPEALLPALDEDAAADLADLLDDAGLSFARIDETLTATITTMGDAVALACDRHTALVVLTRIAREAGGKAIARQRLELIAEGIHYGA